MKKVSNLCLKKSPWSPHGQSRPGSQGCARVGGRLGCAPLGSAGAPPWAGDVGAVRGAAHHARQLRRRRRHRPRGARWAAVEGRKALWAGRGGEGRGGGRAYPQSGIYLFKTGKGGPPPRYPLGGPKLARPHPPLSRWGSGVGRTPQWPVGGGFQR